ncbi:MAG: 16S rRNA (uracil(1498)-N(3))-methyltransferase [Oscillospiraceae bacterium]|nr:16S rRNA (uracil(1498)-N(3))-methyltransferase [Oscillospiraceae bacterium]
MTRFFVSPDVVNGKFAVLTGENATHAKVLRLKEGDMVVLCCGDGQDYNCTISHVAQGQIGLVVQETLPSHTEPSVRCQVFMAFPKADKLEHVIQKATELGADEIIAFPSQRCVSRPDSKSLGKKLERWQKIAASAAEQSGRGQIPTVRALESFREAVKLASQAENPVLLYENEENYSLKNALEDTPCKTVSLMTGPEGGFTTEEIQIAKEAGLKICTLGPRILRCETAPLCALTAVMFFYGELD